MRKSDKFRELEIQLTSSILFYDSKELDNFFVVFDKINQENSIIISGLFVSFVNYLRKIDRDILLIEDPKERKAKVCDNILIRNSTVTNKNKREEFETWFQKVLETDVPMELSDDILDHYVWEQFKLSIEAIDKMDIPFSEKLLIRPKEIVINKNSEIIKFSEIPIPKEESEASFTSGLEDLDLILKPKQTHFMVIAARPSVGKSMFMFNMGINNALNGVKCLYVSLEMSAEQLAERLVNYLAKSNLKDQCKDSYGNLNYEAYAKRYNDILNSGDFKKINENLIYSKPETFSADSILTKVEELIDKEHYKIVFFDYLQLLRYNDIDEWGSLRKLTKQLKTLAFTKNVLIVTGSQVNRSSTEVGLNLTAFSGSSTIEADTDIIVGLENPRETKQNNRAVLNVKIMKQRNGATEEFKYNTDYSTGHMWLED